MAKESNRHLPKCKPAPDEPGTLSQQILALELYLGDPSRRTDPDDAWRRARALAVPHSLPAYLERRGER